MQAIHRDSNISMRFSIRPVRLIFAHRKFDLAVLKVSYREHDEIRIELFFLGSSCVRNPIRSYSLNFGVCCFLIVRAQLVLPDDRYLSNSSPSYRLLENPWAPANASVGQSRALFAVSVKISCPTLAQSSARTGGTSRQRWRDVPTQQTESMEQLRPH